MQLGLLVAAALGDSYGAGFEYVPELIVLANNSGDKYFPHPKHKLAAGCYTDDTQMSLAIAELLIAGEPWLPNVITDKFYEVFKRDPRKGYSRRFQSLLESVSSGPELLEKLTGNNASDKSGAAMRATPLGVLPSIGDILTRSRIQAAVTHNSVDGMNAAMASSLLTHYCLYNLGPKAEAGQFIQDYVDGPWSAPWVGPVGSKGWQSVRAAITAVVESSKMTELLKRCIGYTGDVDTVATIAMAAAAHCKEIERDLPTALWDGLENGTFGRDYLIDLDTQLMKHKG